MSIRDSLIVKNCLWFLFKFLANYRISLNYTLIWRQGHPKFLILRERVQNRRAVRGLIPPPPSKFIQEGLKPTLLVCYVPNYTSFFLTLREFFGGWGGIFIKKFRVHTLGPSCVGFKKILTICG